MRFFCDPPVIQTDLIIIEINRINQKLRQAALINRRSGRTQHLQPVVGRNKIQGVFHHVKLGNNLIFWYG